MTVDLDADLLKSIHRPAVVFALKLNNYKFIPWKTPWGRAVQGHFSAVKESTFTYQFSLQRHTDRSAQERSKQTHRLHDTSFRYMILEWPENYQRYQFFL